MHVASTARAKPVGEYKGELMCETSVMFSEERAARIFQQ